MPNWTTNRVTFEGTSEELGKVKTLLKTHLTTEEGEDDQLFDFNKVIPMPESLDMEDGSPIPYKIITYLTDGLSYDASNLDSRNKKDQELKKTWKKYSLKTHWLAGKTIQQAFVTAKTMFKTEAEIEKAAIDGKQYLDNIDKYDCLTWYDWCYREWGTKWNACNVELEENEDGLTYWFRTAWAEPQPVMEKLASMFPKIQIEHCWLYEFEEREYSTVYNRAVS